MFTLKEKKKQRLLNENKQNQWKDNNRVTYKIISDIVLYYQFRGK